MARISKVLKGIPKFSGTTETELSYDFFMRGRPQATHIKFTGRLSEWEARYLQQLGGRHCYPPVFEYSWIGPEEERKPDVAPTESKRKEAVQRSSVVARPAARDDPPVESGGDKGVSERITDSRKRVVKGSNYR